MKQITLYELLQLFDPSVHGAILEAAAKHRSTHVVLFEDLALEHLEPRRSAMVIGPNNTYKTIEEIEGKPMGATPSQFLYPVSYAGIGSACPDCGCPPMEGPDADGLYDCRCGTFWPVDTSNPEHWDVALKHGLRKEDQND